PAACARQSLHNRTDPTAFDVTRSADGDRIFLSSAELPGHRFLRPDTQMGQNSIYADKQYGNSAAPWLYSIEPVHRGTREAGAYSPFLRQDRMTIGSRFSLSGVLH